MCAILVLMLMCCRGIVLVCSEELLESDTCSSSYKSLAATLVNDDWNFYNLQATFFPPISTKPVFIAITYVYNTSSREPKVFFWSSAVYFFFHPVRIFQFTSLLFSDPSLRYNETTLYLPEECYNASNNFMLLLTQRVSLNLILVVTIRYLN